MEIADRVAYLTIRRPEARNAIDPETRIDPRRRADVLSAYERELMQEV